jgi:hypothetical protein
VHAAVCLLRTHADTHDRVKQPVCRGCSGTAILHHVIFSRCIPLQI